MTDGWMRPHFNGPSLARMLHEVDPRVLCFQLGFELRRWFQRALRRSSRLLPTALYLETSSYCRGSCADCYVSAADRRQHLHLDHTALERVLVAAEQLPLAYVCIVGGEPLDTSVVETNLRLVHDHPRTRFLICTSGNAEIGPELERKLGVLRNLSLLFSFDGLPATHDRIRSPGSFEQACAALETYSRSSGNLCGASITLRNDNWYETTSHAFIKGLIARGCHYFGYAPCETRAADRALSPERLALARGRLAELSTSSPALIFAHPFGQLLGRKIAPTRRLYSLAVDYAGNVYTARRGPSFGSIYDSELTTLLSRPALQAAYRQASASPVDCRSDLVSIRG
jgi:MoaA/NifB/PqqE/SkfB family radical SAM enzyme